MMFRVVFLILLTLPLPSLANCFAAAGQRYSVNSNLLAAISFTESRFRNHATNQNTDGSEDVCMMQINSYWLTVLADRHITRESLLADACLCVNVGAYVLATEISQVGPKWLAVGRYNTGPNGDPEVQRKYVSRIQSAYNQIISGQITVPR
ncbi:lytic transglycosylase domain-containing protein [Aestuariispira insulae]|uniref:Transglycosylase-like protein with SLT domain n=1 Tax=Aestuariispira insulae TaxID=1461337 RepID=A0A3D9H4K9_9PROT|nr:lytic transglycosylase domain-containing protein [Aestuariispira insulae]RED44111.1 transglycosylase-like protein with SLT domain [Aestuariispira insulae]